MATDTSAPARSRKAKKHLLIASVIGVIGLILVTVAALAIIQYILTNSKGGDIPGPETVSVSADIPSEKQPSTEVETVYTVPAHQPRRILIPSLDVSSLVQKVGADKSNVMATPNNIYFTGWYTGSVVPGAEGVSILNGHVGGSYSPGIFSHLKDLKKDATISIEMGDTSKRDFRVVSVASYLVDEAAVPLFADDPEITEELHLITCEGVYDDASKTYDHRVIVVAKLIK